MLYRGAYGFLLINGQAVLHMDSWDITNETPMNEVESFDVDSVEQTPGVSSWSASASGTADFGNTSNQHLLFNASKTKTPVMFSFGLDNGKQTSEDRYSTDNLKKTTYYTGLCYISSFNASFGASDNATISVELTGTGGLELLPKEISDKSFLYSPVILSPGTNAILTTASPLLGTGDRGNHIVYAVFTGETIIGTHGSYLTTDGETATSISTNKSVVKENSSYQGLLQKSLHTQLVKGTTYTLKFAQVPSGTHLDSTKIDEILKSTKVTANQSLPTSVTGVSFTDVTGSASGGTP